MKFAFSFIMLLHFNTVVSKEFSITFHSTGAEFGTLILKWAKIFH